MTGLEIDKSYLAAAITPKAQAISAGTGGGVASHDKSTIQAIATDRYPRVLTRVATRSAFRNGGDAEAGIAAFGPVALSNTDTNAALSVSLSKAMPLATAEGTPGSSRGNTLPVFAPLTSKGLGKTGLVATASVGTTDKPSDAFSMSEMGDGPHAISHAGEAVASSWAGKDPEKVKLLPMLHDDSHEAGHIHSRKAPRSAPSSAPRGADDDGDGSPDDEPTASDLEDVADTPDDTGLDPSLI
jgi:hypothetical protein